MNVKKLHMAIMAFALSMGASKAFGYDMTDEVIKLQRAGVDNEVTLHFVQDSNSSVDLSGDDIQRLEDAGVSSSVIVAMLDRSKELRDDPSKVRAAAAEPPVIPQTQAAPFAVADNDTTEVAAPADGQADISLFYEAMSPYGTWSQDAGNGWVWVPTEATRDPQWRPYANDGHWTWTDQGWYWESASPYGWAAFHYGRWGYNAEHRWSWSPDNVWGPAWVDWRHSETHIGWAPLPIGSRFEPGSGFTYRGKQMGFDFHGGMEEREYAFVDSNAFLNVNLGSSFVPEDRRHNVYTETKVINNTYIYNDNRIINNGVPIAVVSRATKHEVVQVKIVDENIAAGQPIRGEHRNANTIAAYRPKIANKAAIEPPAIVERRKTAAARPAAEHKALTPAARPAPVARQEVKANPEAENQSRQRLIAEKEKRKTGRPTPVAPAAPPAPANPAAKAVTPAETRRNATEEKQTEQQDAAEAKRKAAEEAVNARKADAAAAKDTQVKAREEKQAATQDAAEAKRKATEEATNARKADAAAAKDTQVKAREEKQAATQDAAEEKRKAAEEAVNARKADAAAAKDTQVKAREEKQATQKDAATERKAAAEAQREERNESKEEKAREKK